uniref:uncharacterized protein LOC122588171 n=1 Tax=Erigeron canadensis TaxID=72917 RepID=UPI001CB919FC|nr:uncharacterized protein LOC122588171 [Erigeron canadensis]
MGWMGFPKRWSHWVFGILSSARSSILVNGSPTFEFQCHKGMRQGDPLAPFLFILVMEALSVMFKRAVEAGLVKGVEVGKDNLHISHLLYADDCVILGEWNRDNLKNVARVLRIFNMCSGLKIHLGKSNMYGIGVTGDEVANMAKVVNCAAGTLPFKHLGVWIGANMNRIVNWNFIIDIFDARLSRWRATSLSMAGRIILIKSVLESLPTYSFSLYKAPQKVIECLEVRIRRFLWGSSSDGQKIHWVAWDRVASPVDMGGLGLSKLRDTNVALLSKWLWRFKNEPNSLWRRVIDSIHDTKRGWLHVKVNKYLPGTWNNIVKCFESVKVVGKGINCLLKGVVGNGHDISFWLDNWIGEEPLRHKYPLLFKLEKNKKAMVADKVVGGSGSNCIN